MRARRSLLFVPGTRPDRFAKAMAAGADMVCIDLEDAVPPGEKPAARVAALEHLAQARPVGPELGVRLNGLRTADGIADLAALCARDARPGFVMLPKVQHAEEITLAAEALGARAPFFFPIVESARGLHNVNAVAAHPAVACVLFGAIDLAAETGIENAWEPMLAARSAVALACAAGGAIAFDAPYTDVSDTPGLEAATRRARALGFPARAAIHPAQIGPIHAALTPSDAEVARARAIVAAFGAAGGGAALLDGKLIELPVLKAAERVLAAAGEPATP